MPILLFPQAYNLAIAVGKYILENVAIKSPTTMVEEKIRTAVYRRALSGRVVADEFNSGKRIWTLHYENMQKSDFDAINNLYQSYLQDEDPMDFQIFEDNYPVAQTEVHLDLNEREFSTAGSGYLSEFNLVLTEA